MSILLPQLLLLPFNNLQKLSIKCFNCVFFGASNHPPLLAPPSFLSFLPFIYNTHDPILHKTRCLNCPQPNPTTVFGCLLCTLPFNFPSTTSFPKHSFF
ncbi:hypothetical protein L2E82_33249 [Cichorium intybus]|uniref:Uncharacterized protein n=1 Tax=Cichorium intybus TaxID=13427 RepID=A0ACB9BJM7_CICIN|nr:hypothetical protein L2E82_33249 [Cichorium intybus]